MESRYVPRQIKATETIMELHFADGAAFNATFYLAARGCRSTQLYGPEDGPSPIGPVVTDDHSMTKPCLVLIPNHPICAGDLQVYNRVLQITTALSVGLHLHTSAHRATLRK